SDTSAWALWPHHSSTSVASTTSCGSPCSGSRSVAVRTSASGTCSRTADASAAWMPAGVTRRTDSSSTARGSSLKVVTLQRTCPLRASVGHGADRRARYELGVLRQHAGSVARRSRLPRGPAALELGVLDLEPDQVLVGVDRDEVTLLH